MRTVQFYIQFLGKKALMSATHVDEHCRHVLNAKIKSLWQSWSGGEEGFYGAGRGFVSWIPFPSTSA